MELVLTTPGLPARPEPATMPAVAADECTDGELISRSADRDRARTEPPTEVPEQASAEPGPPERAESSWTAWRVHRALEELSPNERSVIELAYWSGLSQSEVAEYLGIPLGTVKTRTRAALARLADQLEEAIHWGVACD